MRKSLDFTDADIQVLEALFVEMLTLASDVYGDQLFRPFNPDKQDWEPRAQKAFADAVMVGLSEFLDRADKVRGKADQIKGATQEMFKEHEEGTFTGRGNTKEDIRTRIRLFKEMIETAIA